MENIFDGIQRPLKTIAQTSGDCFIPRGVNVPALDVVKTWEFKPTDYKVPAVVLPLHCQAEVCRCWYMVAGGQSLPELQLASAMGLGRARALDSFQRSHRCQLQCQSVQSHLSHTFGPRAH
jgi:ATPsynthase alpha/beta subunit N-term extension